MSWQLIIFDCDGVLVNSEPISNRVLAEALTESGLPLTVQDCYEHFMGRTMADCLEILAGRFGHRVADDFVDRLRQRTLDALRAEVEAVPRVAAALARISAPTCVASSGPLVKMTTTLQRTGLLPLFEDRLFSAAGMARGKPHPDIFLHAAEKMGAEAHACAVIEDSPVGVQAGIAAGMTVFGYAALSDHRALAAAGARVFTDMQELPALLEQHPAPQPAPRLKSGARSGSRS